MVDSQGNKGLRVAMLCVHSHPLGRLGTTDTGGMSVYICQVALELGKRGHVVDIFTRFNGLYSERTIDLSENVRLIQIKAGEKQPLSKLPLYFYLDEFIKGVDLFRDHGGLDYDIIHSHYWLSGWAGLWAQHHWSKPLVVTFHSIGVIKEKGIKNWNEPDLRLTCEKKLVAKCDLIISLTELEKQEIIQLCGGQLSNISVIQCGVDLDTFIPMNKKKARSALQIFDNKVNLLYVGRIDPLKGLGRLLSAAALLKKRLNFRLFIVGGDDPPGQEEERLVEMARNLGIEECVIFSGRVPQKDLPLYYSAADVFVFPSQYESFGLAGLEALACGTPIVATNVGVFSQILTEDFIGSLVFGSELEHLVVKIEEVSARSRNTRNQANQIRNAVTQYSWSQVAKSLCSEYKRLVQPNHVEVKDSAASKSG
jgi:D-inositol-3-phosphate glycosyltransferase